MFLGHSRVGQLHLHAQLQLRHINLWPQILNLWRHNVELALGGAEAESLEMLMMLNLESDAVDVHHLRLKEYRQLLVTEGEERRQKAKTYTWPHQ
mmetsp:Transcript_12229/g.21730  ORF Transcript_12229/g.21730 Transcript_12229/m.21730 type:complete len:95 (+) Transcript_12229:730-1014(+)